MRVISNFSHKTLAEGRIESGPSSPSWIMARIASAICTYTGSGPRLSMSMLRTGILSSCGGSGRVRKSAGDRHGACDRAPDHHSIGAGFERGAALLRCFDLALGDHRYRRTPCQLLDEGQIEV